MAESFRIHTEVRPPGVSNRWAVAAEWTRIAMDVIGRKGPATMEDLDARTADNRVAKGDSIAAVEALFKEHHMGDPEQFLGMAFPSHPAETITAGTFGGIWGEAGWLDFTLSGSNRIELESAMTEFELQVDRSGLGLLIPDYTLKRLPITVTSSVGERRRATPMPTPVPSATQPAPAVPVTKEAKAPGWLARTWHEVWGKVVVAVVSAGILGGLAWLASIIPWPWL